jgi:fluoroquinolone transport system permease protein
MRQLTTLLKWDAVLLHRNNLFVIAGIVAALYMGLFFLLKPLGNLDAILSILIFNDPVVTGYIFAGVLLMFDKGQNTLQALAVLPLKFVNYLLSKIIVLSVLATVIAVLMSLSGAGLGVNYVHLIMGTFFSTFIFSSLGFAVGSISKNFNMFLMYSIPLFILSAVPFFGMFGIGNMYWYALFPSTGGVGLIYAAFVPAGWAQVVFLYAQIGLFSYLCWLVCVRTVTRKML